MNTVRDKEGKCTTGIRLVATNTHGGSFAACVKGKYTRRPVHGGDQHGERYLGRVPFIEHTGRLHRAFFEGTR